MFFTMVTAQIGDGEPIVLPLGFGDMMQGMLEGGGGVGGGGGAFQGALQAALRQSLNLPPGGSSGEETEACEEEEGEGGGGSVRAMLEHMLGGGAWPAPGALLRASPAARRVTARRPPPRNVPPEEGVAELPVVRELLVRTLVKLATEDACKEPFRADKRCCDFHSRKAKAALEARAETRSHADARRGAPATLWRPPPPHTPFAKEKPKKNFLAVLVQKNKKHKYTSTTSIANTV
jgi:hypothetical protein